MVVFARKIDGPVYLVVHSSGRVIYFPEKDPPGSPVAVPTMAVLTNHGFGLGSIKIGLGSFGGMKKEVFALENPVLPRIPGKGKKGLGLGSRGHDPAVPLFPARYVAGGSVVTWGNPRHGGDSGEVRQQLAQVREIQASRGAEAV